MLTIIAGVAWLVGWYGPSSGNSFGPGHLMAAGLALDVLAIVPYLASGRTTTVTVEVE